MTIHYYLRDYMGNNRVVIDQYGTVEQRNNYYAFGGVFESSLFGSTDGVQPYKHGGKELDRMHGLDWYDLGRFPSSMDPLCEKYYPVSPYAYCMNNPVKYVDLKGDSVNVAQVQVHDNVHSTRYTQTIIDDLQSETGLTVSVLDNGQMAYAKDSNGNPIIASTTDANGVVTQNGSVTARNHLVSIINNRNSINVGISNKGSQVRGYNKVWLEPGQINSFIAGATNVDSRTLGWGMTLLHESYHTPVGGGMPDAPYTPGAVVEEMNKIRAELNAQGGNYGQRINYYATPIGNYRYIPFDNPAATGLYLPFLLRPLPINKYIKY